MWPFRRKERDDDEGGAPAPPPERAGVATAAAPAGPPAWSTLPPLRPSLPALHLTVARAAFEDRLSSLRPPQGLALAPLGHIVDPDGPGGVIESLVTVAAPSPAAGATELPLRPPPPPPPPAVQRRPSAPGAAPAPGVSLPTDVRSEGGLTTSPPPADAEYELPVVAGPVPEPLVAPEPAAVEPGPAVPFPERPPEPVAPDGPTAEAPPGPVGPLALGGDRPAGAPADTGDAVAGTPVVEIAAGAGTPAATDHAGPPALSPAAPRAQAGPPSVSRTADHAGPPAPAASFPPGTNEPDMPLARAAVPPGAGRAGPGQPAAGAEVPWEAPGAEGEAVWLEQVGPVHTGRVAPAVDEPAGDERPLGPSPLDTPDEEPVLRNAPVVDGPVPAPPAGLVSPFASLPPAAAPPTVARAADPASPPPAPYPAVPPTVARAADPAVTPDDRPPHRPRRLGLGEPLPSVPTSDAGRLAPPSLPAPSLPPAVQRVAPAAPGPPPASPIGSRPGDPPPTTGPAPERLAHAEAEWAPAPATAPGVLPPVRSPGDPAAPPASSRIGALAPLPVARLAAVPGLASPPAPAAVVRGLLGDRPAPTTSAPTAATTFAAASATPAGEEAPSSVRTLVERAVGADLGGVRVQRDDTSTGAARAMNARAFTARGDVHLPAEHGSLESGQGRSLLAHELVHVAQQRQLGGERPPESSPEGRRLEQHAVMVERAVEANALLPLAPPPAAAPPAADHAHDPLKAAIDAGVAHRDADGTVVFAPPDAPTRTSASPPADTSTTAHATSGGAGPQRAEAEKGADGGEGDVEALAGKVYETIRRKLKAELRLDRERAGILTDRRH